MRLGLESEALRLQGKDAEADLLDIQKEEKQIAEQINRLTAIRNQLLGQGFNRLGATVDTQIRALDAAKKQTIELKKQAVLQKTVGDIFTGQTAAGAFKVALSVAKSTVSSATASPSSPQGKQVTLQIELSDPVQPEEILALATTVYDGLSESDVNKIESIALDRGEFFRDRTSEWPSE